MNKSAAAQQAETSYFLPPAHGILQRKCACGNYAMGGGECSECAKNKHDLQRKLAIGASNDPLELEADRIADQVTAATPAHTAVSSFPLHLQRHAGTTIGGPESIPASVDRTLAGTGRPLESGVQQDMAQRFGHDFSHVRVHSGADAEQSSREVDANAYTVGHNIVFGAGQFSPETGHGRRLIAHELTHVLQQSGPQSQNGAAENQVQRQEATNDKPAATPDLEAIFVQYEKSQGKPPPAWAKEWARKYEQARTKVPEAPPLDEARLIWAVQQRKIWGKEPSLPEKPQPLQLAPGAVGANEILPFPKGANVLVTQLLADVLDKFRTTILFLAKKVSSSPTDLAANAPLILDLLTSPDVSRSLTAKVSESSATLFEAQIVIPDIPAKGQRPAVAARNISVSLEADSPEPSFTLFIDWGSGRSRISGIKARRATDGKVIVTVPIDELKIELGLTREASGAVVAEIDHEWVRKSLSGQSLKLLSMQPMTAVPDTPKAVAERANIEKAAQASKSFTPSGHALSFGGGLQYAGVPSALYSVGWRFTYAVAGDLVGLPLQVQLDYAPKAGLVSGNVGFGVSVTPISIRDVPVTFWLVPGVRAGAVGVGESGTGASPVFGPSVGIGAGFGISPRLQVQLSGEYFHNVLSTAADKGISSVPSVSLGSILRF